MATVEPVIPKSGSILFICGLSAVVAVVAVATVRIVDTAALVAAPVGCRIGMEDRDLLVIFSVYTFSMTALFARSVLVSSR